MKRVLLALLVLFAASGTATAREQLRVAVSSSTLDGVGAIASRFARNTGLPVPALEVTGSAIAFDLFCAGVGFEHVDVVTASRRMSTGEHAKCEKNGVTSITEVEIGRDALVLASGPGAKPMSLGRGSLYAALARELPSADVGEAVSPNAAQQWSDVDPALPKRPIRFIGPSPKSA
jgi:phosphate transport system substrate-binding protein